MQLNKVFIPLIFLLTGFVFAYFLFSGSSPVNDSVPQPGQDHPQLAQTISNPFQTEHATVDKATTDNVYAIDVARLEIMEAEIATLRDKVEQLEAVLAAYSEQARPQGSGAETSTANITPRIPVNSSTFQSALNQRLYNLDNLVRGGIERSRAEDIIRRKNSAQLKELQLQDKATRENYLNTQRYYDELEDLNLQKVDLREELGDQGYDEYLYNSKQNNRIRINSVMLGSAAEQAGILKGDIVLSYDNRNMYNWRELKNATSEGELGEYVSISILRFGQIYSYSVPRGPLGLQLGMTRLAP